MGNKAFNHMMMIKYIFFNTTKFISKLFHYQ